MDTYILFVYVYNSYFGFTDFYDGVHSDFLRFRNDESGWAVVNTYKTTKKHRKRNKYFCEFAELKVAKKLKYPSDVWRGSLFNIFQP